MLTINSKVREEGQCHGGTEVDDEAEQESPLDDEVLRIEGTDPKSYKYMCVGEADGLKQTLDEKPGSATEVKAIRKRRRVS